MYYRLFSETRHPLQTISEVRSAFASWELSEGLAISEPERRSVYQLDQIDEPLDTGYGHFALFYASKHLIRKDFYAFLLRLGVTNIQAFEVELLEIDDNASHPAYLNFNIIGVLDFDELRALSNANPGIEARPPLENNMLLLDTAEGDGNILVHEYAKQKIQARYPGEVYFEAVNE